MVCDGEIVVDGLRNTHEALLFAFLCCIVRQHLDGIHGIVAANIEQTFDLILVHNLEHLIIDFLIAFDLRQFITAGTKEGRRRSFQNLDIRVIFHILGHIHDILCQKALDAMMHSIDFLDSQFLCSREHTCQRRIDDCGRSA